MRRKILLSVVLVLAVAGVLTAVKIHQFRSMIQAGESFVMPPETVSSAVVTRADWETSETAIGTVTAVQGVDIRSEVSGLVETIGFDSGAFVKEGQLLVALDDSTEQAQLASALARAEWARRDYARVRDLHEQQILPRSELESKEAALKQASAEDAEIRVAIAKKAIRAPFAGRVGIRQVQLGQLVEPGTVIVTLQTVDPVHVDFTLPERSAAQVQAGMPVRVTADATGDRVFEGTLTAISPQVEAASRNLELQATLSGTDGLLLPGMFARVQALRSERISPLVVPVTSVQRAPYGDSVFVLADEKDEKTGQAVKRAHMTTVKLGETRGDFVVVESGLQEGQVVASSGVFKLHNGAAVVINDELAPAVAAKPNPTES